MAQVDHKLAARCLALLFSTLLLGLGHTGVKAAGETVASKPVLELFTSQGCNSCPPADSILGSLVHGDEVIALSFPVDYWDYLGWKDTLASPQFSNRQRAYAKSRQDGQVYTPQMVVNGTAHVVGSDKSAIDGAIAKTRDARLARDVGLKIWAEGDTLIIDAGASAAGTRKPSGTIWLALVKKAVPVAITRGENAGSVVTYHNVVRDLSPIGRWSGEKMTLKLPKRDLIRYGADGCTVLLQMDDTGPIIAAVAMKNW